MTPQELRASIIQQAIQGKLVEQRSEEGTGEELFQQIQAEKQTLIKAGKIKKEKPLPEIAEEEIPFDIPDSWKWIRLSDVGQLKNGYSFKSTEYTATGIQVVRISDLGEDAILSTDAVYYPFRDELSQYVIENNSFLICMTGSIGKMAWVKDGVLRYLNQRVGMFVPNPMCCCAYLWHFLHTAHVINGWIRAKTSTNGNIKTSDITELVVPLPPLAEQKRIVAKLEEILPLIDRYEAAWNKLEEFNKRFPGDMQKSILQLAIQGKLVEQRPEESTGEELFQQIQAEKQALIKAGKIKKEKPLPEIAEDEIPFDIPDTWQWARLGSISWYFDAGKSPNCLKQPVTGNDWGVITTTAVQLGHFDEVQNKILPSNFIVNPEIQVRSGDILITRAGPTNRTGIACLVKDIHYNLILSDKIIRINMTDNYFYKDYLIMVLNSPQIRNLIVGLMSGMDKQQVNISQDKYKTLLIPIPPLAEQKRIVAKLEEILPLCDRLK